MRVELGAVNALQVAAERSAKPAMTTAGADAQAVSGDRTSLQSGASTVKSLVSQALTAPPVRQDKVDALKQAIASGTYKIDAGAISDAIVAESEK